MSDHAAWLNWIELQKRATKASSDGELDVAIAIVREALQEADAGTFRSEAFALLAHFHEARGELEEARNLLREAISLAAEGSYNRYAFEVTLGGVYEALSDTGSALDCYRQALATASKDGTTSAGTALLNFSRLWGDEPLSPDDRQLAELCVRQSWQLLRLEGEPDLQDLHTSARLLLEAQGRPIPSS